MEKYNKYHESLDIDCCDKEINKPKKKSNCCCDGINLPSHNNEIEVLIKQLKREVKELLQTTQAKLLCQDKKIAETMVYIKNNLSNYIRDLLDSMLLSGELEQIIKDTVLGEWVKMTPFSTGIDIEENTDINNLLSPCSYYSKDASVTATLTNVPSQINSGFVLINQYVTHSGIKQIILPNSQSHVFFIRHIIKSNGEWVYRNWGVYTGEDASTYLSPINE